MAVEINIDLDSTKAHGKIEALEARLKAVNDNVDLDFDVDGDLKESIQEITDELNEIDIDVDYSDLQKAAALKAMLEGDIETDLNIDSDGIMREIEDGLDPPDIDHDEQARKFSSMEPEGARFERFEKRMKRWTEQRRTPSGAFAGKDYYRRFLKEQRAGGLNQVSVDLDGLKKDISRKVTTARVLEDQLGGKNYGKIGDPFGDRSYDSARLSRTRGLMKGRLNESLDFDFDLDMKDLPDVSKLIQGGLGGDDIESFSEKVRRMVPNMNTFYNILAALIPILVVVGTQALGVAAAMGAVAVAGASLIALGLVGHGDDMASSWREAKEQLSTLKEELFETFQPTMQTFAPIQARLFDVLPDMLDEVASSMEGLTVYSDTLFASMRGLSQWIANGFRGMADMAGIASQLALRFGDILGTNINQFFRFIVEEAYASQGMLIEVGSAFKDIAVAVYGIFKSLVQVLTVFSPLINILEIVETLMNNKVAVAIMTFIATISLLTVTVFGLTGAFAYLSSIWAGGFLATISASVMAIQGWIASSIAATLTTYGLSASIASAVSWATLGIGAFLGLAAAAAAVDGVNAQAETTMSKFSGGSGMPTGGAQYGSGGAGSGTTQNIVNHGDTYNMEVNGSVDNATEEGLRDMIASEGNISNARKPPSTGA